MDHAQLRLDVQGRFEQVPRNIYGEVNATHITAIVAASNNSVPIEVCIYLLELTEDRRRSHVRNLFMDLPYNYSNRVVGKHPFFP